MKEDTGRECQEDQALEARKHDEVVGWWEPYGEVGGRWEVQFQNWRLASYWHCNCSLGTRPEPEPEPIECQWQCECYNILACVAITFASMVLARWVATRIGVCLTDNEVPPEESDVTCTGSPSADIARFTT